MKLSNKSKYKAPLQITADKREIIDPPKLPSATSFIRHPLYEMRAEAKIFRKSKSKSNKRGEI